MCGSKQGSLHDKELKSMQASQVSQVSQTWNKHLQSITYTGYRLPHVEHAVSHVCGESLKLHLHVNDQEKGFYERNPALCTQWKMHYYTCIYLHVINLSHGLH